MAGGRNREWMRKQMAMAMATARKESPRWTRRVRALSAAMRRPGRNGLSRADRLRLLYESVVFRLLWVLETLIVLATLCFFFFRFGFRL